MGCLLDGAYDYPFRGVPAANCEGSLLVAHVEIVLCPDFCLDPPYYAYGVRDPWALQQCLRFARSSPLLACNFSLL
jgi:hypothetical protein